MRTQPRHLARPTGVHRRRFRKPVAASTAIWLALITLFAVGASPARATVPNANDDTATTAVDTAAYISVLANDSDPDFEPIQVTGATDPEHGSVTCAPGGICIYLPDSGFTGADSFRYDVSDGTESASAGVSITVTAAVAGNRPPTATDDEFTAGSGAWAFLTLLDNDTDPDSDPLQINAVTTPTHGTLDCTSSVYCVYESDVGYAGPDAFTYAAADLRGGTDTASVAVTVEPNTGPMATDDNLITRANASARSINVIANDSDADGDSLTAELSTAPLHGTASCSDKVCDYTPDANFVGPDSFTYTADDARGGTDVATVSVEVTANHAPNVVDEEVAAVQGVTLALSLLENDSDSDGDRLRVVETSDPETGDLSCDANGFCDYTAPDDFVGTDGFSYSVSDGSDITTGQVQISVTEPCPPARCIDNGTIALAVHPEGHLNVPDGSGSVAGEGSVGLAFLPTGNEATAPGCLCEGWGAADAASGVTGYVSEDTDGGANNLTVDSFDATASTAESVVTIGGSMRVTHDFHPSPITPNLYEIDVTIENLSEEELADIRYRRVTDWDVEPTVFSEYVTIQGGGAANLLFDSDHGFATANPLGERPSIAATGDFVDSGPFDHGALFDFGFGALEAGSQRSFTIFYGAAATESAAENALDAVGAEVYSLAQPDTDEGATLGTPNTFMVAFDGVDGDPSAPPVAVDDELSTDQDVAGSVDVLANDSDPDGDALSVTTSSPEAGHGEVSCTEAGVCTYTPDAGFSGDDSFDYSISDGHGATATASVAVEVLRLTPDNRDPIAVGDELSLAADAAGSVDVLANDSDPDGDALSVTTSSPEAGHGEVSCTEAGVCAYTPDAGFSGDDSFDYSISDGNEGAASATVVVSVEPDPGRLELSLSAAQVEAEYSDPVGPIAVTTSGGDQAFGTVLTATGLPASIELLDHADGTGDIAGVLTAGEGQYDAAITATNNDQVAGQDLGLLISPEQAGVDYTGTSTAPVADGSTGADVTLSARLRQEADGSPGDITRARVYFDLYAEANTAMATPDLTVGPVAPSQEGIASSAAELAVGNWVVVVRFEESNAYFTGPADEAATIDVGTRAPGHKAFGIGWAAEPGGRQQHIGSHHGHKGINGYGRFCFAYGVRADDGEVWGSASYAFRSEGRRYVLRSGKLNRAVFSAGQTGATSIAKGMGSVWVVDPAKRHKHRSLVGRVWFRMDVTDGSAGSVDRFALSIWKDGALWHRVGTSRAPRVAHGHIRIS